MTQVALVRIDDRLIHGQVVVKGLRHLECDEIWIVDDQLYGDDFMQSVLRLAAPPEVRVQVTPVREATRRLEQPLNNGHRVMVLLKSPQTALALLDDGLQFEELNVGGLAAGAGTTRLYKSVSATDEHIAALRAIRDRGVRVYFQMVPEERPLEMAAVLPLKPLAHNVAVH